jgi:hypothetical protein
VTEIGTGSEFRTGQQAPVSGVYRFVASAEANSEANLAPTEIP